MARGSNEGQESFSVERQEGRGIRRLYLSGVIDEFADLTFFKHLHGRVEINMRDVRRINSFGVRAWVDGVRSVPDDAELLFVEVAPPVVEQMNMVQGFLGRGKIRSFLAPVFCEDCDLHDLVLVETEECRQRALPPKKCPECGQPMELDDIEEQYLAFLSDERP